MKMEEQISMSKKQKFILRPIMAVALLAVLLTSTAFAAWRLLTPEDVADYLQYPLLSEAFRDSSAILIHETKSQNGYDFTFLGIVSGNGLRGINESVKADRTYAVIAIEKQDGLMPDVSDADYGNPPLFISPLIKGQKPWQVNIASMNGGHETFVLDGVMYRIIETDNLEMFADRGLVLCISSTFFYDINAFDYDETTGLVTPNPHYDGINLLFDFSLDASKADFEKAENYLQSLTTVNPPAGNEDGIESDDPVSVDLVSDVSISWEDVTFEIVDINEGFNIINGSDGLIITH